MMRKRKKVEDNIIFETYLIPKLSAFRQYLGENGIRSEMSVDADDIPGLLVFTDDGRSVYITFIEKDFENPELMRITVTYSDKEEPVTAKELKFRNLMVSAEEIITVEDFRKAVAVSLSNVMLRPYPTADLVGKDPVSEADTGEDSVIDEKAVLLPRTNRLLGGILAAGAEESEISVSKIPYVAVSDGDGAYISAFEEVGDNEFLLHFRADISYDKDEDIEKLKEKVSLFNEEHFFVRASLGEQDLGIYEDESDNVITFHALTIDNGEGKSEDFYGFFIGFFEAEVTDFFEEEF